MGAYWSNKMVFFDIKKKINPKDIETDRTSTPLIGIKVHIALLVQIVDFQKMHSLSGHQNGSLLG